jgi:hypothetical protein
VAIDTDKLKGEVAIELDADSVTAGEFQSALDAFLTLIRELTRQVNERLPQDSWRLTVQEGSQVIAFQPDKIKLTESVRAAIYASLFDGLDSLEREAKAPKYFTERALECARELSLIAHGPRDQGSPVRILSRQRTRAITRATWINVSEILDWKYEDVGTVEGTLEVVSAHDGYEFRIYEPLWLRAVRCHFQEERLADALANFKKRVEVQGLIRYTKDGFPVSVNVLSITPLPDPKDLPSYRAVKGILGGRHGA